MAVFSMVFERQGEASGEVNGLAHVCLRPPADNPGLAPCNNVSHEDNPRFFGVPAVPVVSAA